MTSKSCSSLLGWMGFCLWKICPRRFIRLSALQVSRYSASGPAPAKAPKYFNYATRSSYYINQVLGSLSVSSKIGIYKDWSCRLTFDVFIVEGRKGYVWRWCRRLLGYLTHRGCKLADTCFDYNFSPAIHSWLMDTHTQLKSEPGLDLDDKVSYLLNVFGTLVIIDF